MRTALFFTVFIAVAGFLSYVADATEAFACVAIPALALWGIVAGFRLAFKLMKAGK